MVWTTCGLQCGRRAIDCFSVSKRTDQRVTTLRPDAVPLLKAVADEQGLKLIDVVTATVRWLHAQPSEVRHAIIRAGRGLPAHDEPTARRRLTFDAVSEESPARASSSGSPHSGRRARPAA